VKEAIGAGAYTQEGNVPLQFPEWGREGHRTRAHVNAQRYKLIALFVKTVMILIYN